jgi:chromosome segregation ATPase
VRNRTSFVHFDERIPLLWQMEHRLKQLHRDNERIKKAFDELKDKFTSLQQDSTDRIAELQRKETEILELNKRYSGATEQLKELQHTYRSQLSEFQSSCEKAEKALDFFKKRCNELETENIAAKASYEKSAEKANHLTGIFLLVIKRFFFETT